MAPEASQGKAQQSSAGVLPARADRDALVHRGLGAFHRQGKP